MNRVSAQAREIDGSKLNFLKGARTIMALHLGLSYWEATKLAEPSTRRAGLDPTLRIQVASQKRQASR